MAAVRGDDLAVQDHVRRPLGHGPFQGLLQAGSLRGNHRRALGYVAVRRRLRQPEPGPQPRDVRFIPVPGQDEQRLPVTAQAAGTLPGPGLLAVPGQQPRDEQDELPGHVKSDTIGDQRGVSRQADVLQRDPFYRELRAFPAMSACIRVSACMGAMRRVTDSALLRKPQ